MTVGPLTPLGYWRGTVDGKLDEHDERIDEHDHRIEDLEHARWKFAGVTAVAIVLASVAGGVLSMVVGYLLLSALHIHTP